MTVKEVVLKAAKLLGIGEEVNNYLEGEPTSSNDEIYAKKLLLAYNQVEGELALDYLPLQQEDILTPRLEKVYYNVFSYSPIRVLCVKNEAGEEVPYTIFPQYIQVTAPKAYVTYTYTPNEKTFQDDSEYSLFMSAWLMAYGVAAEYCLCEGRYEEAAVWDKKYKDGITSAYQMQKGDRIKERRWA